MFPALGDFPTLVINIKVLVPVLGVPGCMSVSVPAGRVSVVFVIILVALARPRTVRAGPAGVLGLTTSVLSPRLLASTVASTVRLSFSVPAPASLRRALFFPCLAPVPSKLNFGS